MYILKCQIQNKIKFPKKWCFLKKINDILVVKTHLVAKCFAEKYNEKRQNESPTYSKEALRIAITLITQNIWKLNLIDTKTAFPQGEEIDGEIFFITFYYQQNNKLIRWITIFGTKYSRMDKAKFVEDSL